MAAFLAPLIGAGASWGLNKLFGGGGGTAKVGPTSPTFRRAEQLGDLSKTYAFDYALPEGQKLLTGAESTLQKPLDYYTKLLSGNRAEMMSAEAPEIQTIADQYAQNKANISKFTPQGGGQTGLLSELPFQQSRDVTTLLEKARPAAAQGLERIAGQQGALSGMVSGEGLQAGGLSLNAISDQINALLGKAGLEIPLQQQTGAALYKMLMGQNQQTPQGPQPFQLPTTTANPAGVGGGTDPFSSISPGGGSPIDISQTPGWLPGPDVGGAP